MGRLIRKTLYVDGSNLFGGLSELVRSGEYIDFASLLPIISRSFQGIDRVKFYSAFMRVHPNMSKRDYLFAKAQVEFLNSVIALPDVHFGRGNISKHGKEKGVDLRLGIDMVRDAYNDEYDDAILLSGDADFLYAVETIRALGKNIHHCTIATRYNSKLSYKTWRKVILDYQMHFMEQVVPGKRHMPRNIKVVDISKVETKKVV